MIALVLSKVVARFVRDQRGATMVEYGLLLGLVAIAAIVGLTALGTAINTMFNSVEDNL